MCSKASNAKILCDIANCGFDVVARLLERDQLLAQELRSTTTQSRQIYREECMTLDIAVTLRERFKDYVEIVLFTGHEEKRNGADWYWRFQTDDRAIHAHVQAKRVQRTDFGQPDEAGYINFDLEQLDVLRTCLQTRFFMRPGGVTSR